MSEEPEQALVGVVGVLDQQGHGRDGGQPLEEHPPAGVELVPVEHGCRLGGVADPEQPRQACADVVPLRRVVDEAQHALAHLGLGHVGRVLLGDAEPLADDLGERPVRHALAAKGQAVAPVPEHGAGQPVRVLLELPSEP